MVEFALVLPALMLILVAIVQFGVIFKQYVTLTDAVREGARKAAVARLKSDPTGYTQGEVVKSASDLDGFTTANVVVTSTWKPGEDVVVQGRFDFSIDIIGRVVHAGTMTSTATERVE